MPTDGGIELEKYRLDREHELELNKFSHALEMERLKILSYLNGGAVGVYLALVKDRLSGADPGLAAASTVAVLFWLAGLVAAATAIQSNLTTQVAFARAYHHRRRATEWRLFKRSGFPAAKLLRMVAPPPDLPEKATDDGDDDLFDRSAQRAIEEGRTAARQIIWKARGAVLAFVLGAACATLGVIFSCSGPSALP